MRSRLERMPRMQGETENEIDKELAAAFKEKKRRALELYEQDNEPYENNRFFKSIPLFDAALEIVKTASFYSTRGNTRLRCGST